MLTYLYNLIIMPLILVVELIFTVMYRMIGNAGLAIIGVSVVVSVLILPLYRRADAMQEAERDKQAAMQHWVDHIKRTFRGDEQYMMLTTYYRQMNYHPLYALRSSISLLLQIPFFIAAYRFLSGLAVLRGVSFGPIADLSLPDRMLALGGVSINVLPVLMTVINLLSGAVYSKGLPFRMKAQQYGLTLLFLILLYNRPAGLVLYWTMNNVFSLVKNLLTKVSRHPGRDTAVCSSLLGIMFAVVSYSRIVSRKRLILAAAVFLAAQIPLLVMLVRHLRRREEAGRESLAQEKPPVPRILFVLGGIFFTLLAGFLIPISVISDSPAEFITVNAYVTPLRFVFSTLSIAAGFFLVWANIFYSLAPEKFRHLFSCLFWLCSFGALINYMFFNRSFGDMTTELTFEDPVLYGWNQILLNIAVLVFAAAVLYLVWRKRRALVSRMYAVAIMGVAALCIYNTVQTQTYLGRMDGLVPASKAASGEQPGEEYEPIFRLSKTGKNVIVLMMDRMINGYLPYLMKEKPELKEQFTGFTWYPNTISFGRKTNTGSPALFGGYEYTPTEMNKRDTELLMDKQNELLKVMPVMFLNEGYEVTVCDPPYAGYQWIPDLSIYDDYPDIKAYNTMQMYSDELNREFGPDYEKLQKRNFFFYSIFRMMPDILQAPVYDRGRYYNASVNNVVDQKFIASYGALTHLPDMVEITEEEQDTFLMMTNKTSHEIIQLQLPDYEPSLYVDNSGLYDPENYTIDGVTLSMDTEKKQKHYAVNMASMLKLGEWMDYLKENGVYDNTRIIIVADHGRPLKQLKPLRNSKVDIMMLNPMLLVKDFGADGGIRRCDDFMTNADTPVLATNGLIEDPVNPFTGRKITDEEKYAHPQVVTTSLRWRTSKEDKTFNTSDGKWLSVHDDIFDENNWELLE